MDLIKDDPVRPCIPSAMRVHDHAEIMALLEGTRALAVVCVAYLDQIPTTEQELGKVGTNVAAFYTIWSYQRGAGRELLAQARSYIKATRPEITRYVTLSPKTELARRFHHSNGAVTLQLNDNTVNYEYR